MTLTHRAENELSDIKGNRNWVKIIPSNKNEVSFKDNWFLKSLRIYFPFIYLKKHKLNHLPEVDKTVLVFKAPLFNKSVAKYQELP